MDADSSLLYEPLDPQRPQIRLLWLDHDDIKEDSEISCRMHTVYLDNDDTLIYQALSYEWGSDRNMKHIRLNGRLVSIRSNLHEFLLLKRSKARLRRLPVWVDQLCIDQSCIQERNHQVALMWQLYSNAHETLIWLGSDPDGGLAFATMERAYARYHKFRLTSHPSPHDALTAFWRDEVNGVDEGACKSLSMLSYWAWHWVAQEVVLSNVRTLMYGVGELDFDKLAELHSEELFYMEFHENTTLQRFMCVDELRRDRQYFYDYTSSALEDVSHFASRSLCSDPRDKVFGIQNVLDYDLRIPIDYGQSVRVVFLKAAETCFQQSTHVETSRGEYISVRLASFLSAVSDLALGMGFARPKNCDGLKGKLEHEYRILVGDHTPWKAGQDVQMISWDQMRRVLDKHLLRVPNGDSSLSDSAT